MNILRRNWPSLVIASAIAGIMLIAVYVAVSHHIAGIQVELPPNFLDWITQ